MADAVGTRRKAPRGASWLVHFRISLHGRIGRIRFRQRRSKGMGLVPGIHIGLIQRLTGRGIGHHRLGDDPHGLTLVGVAGRRRHLMTTLVNIRTFGGQVQVAHIFVGPCIL